jgi:glycogen debranching enzyme
MIQALCRVGRDADALAMLDPLVRETLDHGAVGAIREIRDGADTGATEEFGGATFQAWSMAEMIRAMHEDLAPALGWDTSAQVD